MSDEFEPRIVAFLCNWCSYAGADLAGVSRLQMPASLRVIRVMCSSRVDPLFVIKAFLGGADGVLIGGCHPGDCHYLKGNYHARRKFALLNKIFEELGLDAERLRLSWISASEGPRFAEVVTAFTQKIKELGPNPTRKEVFI
ncbi:hydrogenase iron-sulfur subunit [Candidatus Bipolaricaulota bacterium]|jgi:F420-non-reducing hydrogenase iron-sulfur subunit|nr:hydrogenase iron-sulfur subunit [Candidatus Bipolaricaulota bacterium]